MNSKRKKKTFEQQISNCIIMFLCMIGGIMLLFLGINLITNTIFNSYINIKQIIISIIQFFCIVGIGMLLKRKLIKYNKKTIQIMDKMDELFCGICEEESGKKKRDCLEEDNLNRVLELIKQGLVDHLTGLATRTIFLSRIEQRQKQLKEHEITALCFIDLDDLKKINDTYGHMVGDNALAKIGIVVKEFEKIHNGIAGRYGGDEFILWIDGIDSQKELEVILNELVQKLRIQLIWEQQCISINCSIGVTQIKSKDKKLEEVIEETDCALYQAKKKGKNQFYIIP